MKAVDNKILLPVSEEVGGIVSRGEWCELSREDAEVLASAIKYAQQFRRPKYSKQLALLAEWARLVASGQPAAAEGEARRRGLSVRTTPQTSDTEEHILFTTVRKECGK